MVSGLTKSTDHPGRLLIHVGAMVKTPYIQPDKAY